MSDEDLKGGVSAKLQFVSIYRSCSISMEIKSLTKPHFKTGYYKKLVYFVGQEIFILFHRN